MIAIQGAHAWAHGATIGSLLGLVLGEASEWALGTLLPPFPFKPNVWFLVWSFVWINGADGSAYHGGRRPVAVGKAINRYKPTRRPSLNLATCSL